MAFPVLFDACVLAPYPLVDVLLRLADKGIYRPLWSHDILIETRRTMVEKLHLPPEKADGRLNIMRDNFIDAEVTGYQELIGAMCNNEKDRHVLAAAVRERAEVIVTSDRTGSPQRPSNPIASRCGTQTTSYSTKSICTKTPSIQHFSGCWLSGPTRRSLRTSFLMR